MEHFRLTCFGAGNVSRRTGSVVAHSTSDREVRGSNPTLV